MIYTFFNKEKRKGKEMKRWDFILGMSFKQVNIEHFNLFFDRPRMYGPRVINYPIDLFTNRENLHGENPTR